MPLWRARVLAVLQLAPHRHLGHLRHLAPIGVSIGDLAGGDPARFATLAAVTAVLTAAALAFAAWAAKAGVVVNFVSETVLVGFKCGVAFVLASTQIPKLGGFPGGEGDFWSRAAHIVEHIGETHQASLLSAWSLSRVLLAGKRLLPNKPVALIVVAAGIAATSVFDLGALGVHTLAPSRRDCRHGVPDSRPRLINDLLPIAMACFLLASVETAAIGRMFALKHGYRFDPNREFLAIGSANLLSGLGHGFPISGGLSQSLVNESAGARTPLSGLVAALIILTITLFFSGVLSDLPQPVLAAIVLAAVTGLVHGSVIRRLWRFSREEFAVAALAFLGVLGFRPPPRRADRRGAVDPLAAAARVATKRRGARARGQHHAVCQPHAAAPIAPACPARSCSGWTAPCWYFNVEYVRDQFAEQLAAREDAIRTAVFFLGTVPNVDLAGADLLIDLRHHLAGRGIELRFAGARAEVRRELVRAGLDPCCGRGLPRRGRGARWQQVERHGEDQIHHQHEHADEPRRAAAVGDQRRR